ncbi:MAG: PKD domain-containing protein [Gammaproteobacteria bacterium]
MSQTSQAAISDTLVQEALKALYTSTDGPNWKVNTGWSADADIDILCPDPDAVPEIVTHGIVCDSSDNVEKLDLSDNNLVGTIPAEIGNLSNLVRLKLQNNKLNDNIPSELGLLSKLVTLSLFDNDLEGPIPSSLSSLTNLLYFELYNNRLSGQLPKELGKLAMLWNFYVQGNQFIGDLPIELMNIGNAYTDDIHLDLRWNGLRSDDATLNSFIDSNHITHVNLIPYKDSQTVAPTGFILDGKTTTSVELSWAAFDTTPSTTGGYKILQSTSAGGPFTQVVPDINNRSVTSTTINNLQEGVNYWFKVCNYTNTHDDNLKNMVISEDSAAVSKGVPAVGAGVDQFVDELTTVNLSSTASDTDGTIVGYSWSQLSGPDADDLINTDTASASFSAPEVSIGGDVLTFRVTVTDDDGDIAYDDVQVTVNNVLAAPTVSAGVNKTANESDVVSLTATASDPSPNGTIDRYFWEQVEGPPVSIIVDSLDEAKVSFTAPSIDVSSESLLFMVTVTDNDDQIATDTVLVTVNNAPTVTVGIDQTVNEGDSVSLSAIASDGGESTLNYQWQQVSGLPVTINSATSADAGFTAPGIDTESTNLEFKVTVTDDEGATATDNVVVTINNVIVAPTVSAIGPDQTIYEANVVTLSAMASDGNGTIDSYLWEQVSGSQVTLSSNSLANVSFTHLINSLVVSEDLEFIVTVTDNDGGTATDNVRVTVNNVFMPPVADAGPAQSVDERTTVTLSATASRDDNGSIISHNWRQISGTNQVVLTPSDTNPAIVTFEAPAVEVAGDVLVFELTVTDNDGQTAIDEVQVTVNDVKIEPETDPSTDQPGDEAEEGNWIELNANAFDVDGQVVTYHWEQLLGPTVDLETTDTPTTRFEAPTITNRRVRLLFRVTVTDDDELIGRGLIYVIITKRNVIVVGNGALSWPWLLLLAVPLLGRRYLK